MRRFAGLLPALFTGHLSTVAVGAVCVVPGLVPMAAGMMEAEDDASMAAMTGRGRSLSPYAESDEQNRIVSASATNRLPSGRVAELAVLMPASSGTVPDHPPPRA